MDTSSYFRFDDDNKAKDVYIQLRVAVDHAICIACVLFDVSELFWGFCVFVIDRQIHW